MFVLLAIPIFSWAFFRFVHYPAEIERHTHGDYMLIAYAEPSHWDSIFTQLIYEAQLVFGDIHNNTQVIVDLLISHK